jgi:pyruvate ferredoxin oxidoreductase alpha subunit
MGAPWSVWTDQNDSLSQRDTGWIQIYCESNQEVLDSVLHAYRTAEAVSLPVMLVLDAFVLSHTAEPVDIPDQEAVDEFLPPYEPAHRLDPSSPEAISSLATPDSYMEFRVKIQEGMERALEVLEETDLAFEESFGRRYGLIESYRADDASLLLVTSGTITSTSRVVVDQLRDEGQRVGLLKIRIFRPFPTAAISRVVSRVEKVAVIDRNISFGVGGIFAQEIRAALYNRLRVPVFGFVAGLGGRDVTPAVIREIVDYAITRENPEDLVWVGVKE